MSLSNSTHYTYSVFTHLPQKNEKSLMNNINISIRNSTNICIRKVSVISTRANLDTAVYIKPLSFIKSDSDGRFYDQRSNNKHKMKEKENIRSPIYTGIRLPNEVIKIFK
ncbi:unnamed protein product [Cunninghamella blakesleeana]